jgi:inner membrane transporter RhtA
MERPSVGALIVLPADVTQAEGALVEPEAVRRLPAAVFGVLMSLDPAVAALAGFVMLGQDLGARELLGIAMVVVASAGAASLSQR